jgi:hypothetical protein
MGLGILLTIVGVSLLAGVAVQRLGSRKSPYDVLIVGLTAAFAAYFASESFPGSTVFATIKDFGPSIDGFYVIPGIAFAFLITTVSYVGTRETYAPDTATA